MLRSAVVDPPDGVELKVNEDDLDFVGANASVIKRHGAAVTTCEHKLGAFDTWWAVAEVSGALNSVAQTRGPSEHPIGNQDVLINNKTCYVAPPPGVDEEIVQRAKLVAEFPRGGNLCAAELTLSSFARQDPGR